MMSCLLSFAVLAQATADDRRPLPSVAERPLPIGTLITLPEGALDGGASVTLDRPLFLVGRGEIKECLLDRKARGQFEVALADCEARECGSDPGVSVGTVVAIAGVTGAVAVAVGIVVGVLIPRPAQ